MVRNSNHKYNLKETVCLGDEELGIIERIIIKEETKIDSEGTSNSRDVTYGVRSDYLSIFNYGESNLAPSKRQLHNDAFRVKEGQIILRDNNEYIVESARGGLQSFPGGAMGRVHTGQVWYVKARKLDNGKYDPNGEIIEFDQEEDKKPIDIIRTMNVKTIYE